MIIAAYAGVGKTTFAELHPDKVIDFVCMPYKYYLQPGSDAGEAGKANPDSIMRPDWPFNYVEAIKSALANEKIILIPSNTYVLNLLRADDIPYTLVYPQRNAKEIYEKHYIDRGNTKSFLDIFIGSWDCFLGELERDTYGEHIVLQPHQFLSHVIEVGCIFRLTGRPDESNCSSNQQKIFG